MESIEYKILSHREEDYWWYVGLHDLVMGTITGYLKNKIDIKILDAGCGTGKLLELCKDYPSFGLEYALEAFPFLKRRGLSNVVQGSVLQMPFPDNSFDLVVSMDVIYHVTAPGDFRALLEMKRVLKPGGILLLNLPAYECLRSHHDAAVHTKQRYTRRRIRALLAEAGWKIQTITYRNTLLFPIAAAVRGLQKLFSPNPSTLKSDLSPLPRFVNQALTIPLYMENRMIQWGGRLPFGLSLYCVAVKP